VIQTLMTVVDSDSADDDGDGDACLSTLDTGALHQKPRYHSLTNSILQYFRCETTFEQCACIPHSVSNYQLNPNF